MRAVEHATLLGCYRCKAFSKAVATIRSLPKGIGRRTVALLAGWLLCVLVGMALGERSLHLFTLHEYVVQLNQLRVSFGLPPLKLNWALCEAAQAQANEILIVQECSHVDREGRRADRRALEAGYPFSILAENLAAGQPTWERALEGWLNSPSHRMAMLAPHYREIGIGSAWGTGKRFTHAWAQVLGTRRGGYPLIIELDALWTDSPKVRLYVHGTQYANAMRFSNDGEQWTDWMPPKEWVDWELPNEPGEHTVYVQLRIRGRVYESSDSILLR